MRPAVASDYTWFAERFPELARAYCLTMVRGLTPGQVLDQFGVRDRVELRGIEPLVSAAYALWADDQNDRFFVAATAVDGWALVIEPNGFLGVAHRVGVPLSAGTRLVAHFRTAEALDQFSWIEDGDIRLRFEPQFPGERSGSDKDGVVEAMRQVGFANPVAAAELVTGASFALAEHLTGVRLTADLLDSALYSCGSAAAP